MGRRRQQQYSVLEAEQPLTSRLPRRHLSRLDDKESGLPKLCATVMLQFHSEDLQIGQAGRNYPSVVASLYL